MGLNLAQCVFVKMSIMQMVAAHKRSSRESVDRFVSCYLTEQLEGTSRKKYNMSSCESEKTPTSYCANSWPLISKVMAIFVPCLLATVENSIKSS